MRIGNYHLTHRSFISYLAFSVAILVIFNIYIYQDDAQDYSVNQAVTANSVIIALEARVELPLLAADNETIKVEVNGLGISEQVLLIEVRDNENVLVANRTNANIDVNTIYQYPFYDKDILDEATASDFEDIFSEEDVRPEPQKIGSIGVYMKPFSLLQTSKGNHLVYFYNLILIALLLLVAALFYKRVNRAKNQLLQLSDFLNSSKNYPLEASDSFEFDQLTQSAVNAMDKIAKQNIQLANLHQEIRYAREDSNLELNRFLEFLIQSEKLTFNDDLKVFSDSVLESKISEKTLANISRMLSSTIAAHSDLATANNVLVYDNILNKLQEYSVFIDEPLFQQFLSLFIEQLIQLCKNAEININADINSLHDDSHMLRLSFESSSPAFSKALEQQSLFDFIPTPETSISINNPSFIACKHLIQKSGGDYIFLQQEIRFEFPVLIEKNYVSSSNLSLVKPLDVERNLLVYDSDPTERIVLMGYLDKFGQKLDKATTKQVVLQKLRHKTYDILCVNSDFFSDQDPYFLTNFKSEYLNTKQPPLLVVISSNEKIIKNEYFKSFNAKLLRKPIDLNSLEKLLTDLA